MNTTTGSGMRRVVRSSAWDRPRFEALVNFRDLGGHATDRHRATRSRMLYRADGVHRCTPADVATLEAIGVRRVVDLRTTNERVTDGSFMPQHPTIEYRHVPLLDDVSGIGEIGDEEPLVVSYLHVIDEFGGEEPLVAPYPHVIDEFVHEEPLVVSYLNMIDACGPRIVQVLDAIMGSPGPVVFHCTAGKDRTGVIAALILQTLGVPRETIVADYAKSEAAMDRLIAWYRAHRPELDWACRRIVDLPNARLMGARPEWMHKVLDELDDCYGGAARYLLAAGATPTMLRMLRMRMLAG